VEKMKEQKFTLNIHSLFFQVFILLFAVVPILAQSGIILKNFDASNYPNIKSNIFIFDDSSNFPIQTYTEKNIVVLDNGITPNNITLTNPPQNLNSNLSIDLIVDLGLDNNAPVGNTRFQMGTTFCNNFINLIDTTQIETAVTSFDAINYVNQTFTNSKFKLQSAIKTLSPSYSSYLGEAFLDKPAGALEMFRNAKYQKIAILITDGAGLNNKDSVINQLISNGIKVFVLVIGKPISFDLLDVVNKTNGDYLDSITSKTDLKLIAKYFYSLVLNYQASVVSWDLPFTCSDNHDAEIDLPAKSYQVKFNYNIISRAKPIITTTPIALGFASVLPSKTKDLDIALTAVNADITITKFSIQDPRFQIVAGDVTGGQLLIKENESHTLTIRYSPTDSAITFTTLKIESNACLGNEVYLTGGFPNTPPIERTIKLLTPECKTTLVPLDTFSIIWTGLLPQDVIQLEYSIDNGRNWDTLARNVTDLVYKWTVPNVVSDECLIRAIQLWPNNVGRTMNLKHNADVNSAFFNKEGNLVITASSDGTAAIWNSNTGKVIYYLLGHGGTVNYAVFNNAGNRAATVGDDGNVIIWDATNGQKLYQKHYGNIVLSVKFSPDDQHIVVAVKDGHAYVLNANDLSPEQDLNVSPNGVCWYAEFSPDGQKVLTASNDGIAKVWDWANNPNVPIQNFDVRYSGYANVIHATYNYNATKVAVTDQASKRVIVFNTQTGDTLFTLTHNTKVNDNIVIFSSSFYYDTKYGEMILTAGEDKVARLWDANKGIPVPPQIFQEHTEAVLTAVFNFDAKRVLTASRDFTAKIWNLDQRDLQMDTTACLFRIKPIKIEVSNIDFPEVPVNDSKDTIIAPFLKNTTDFDYQIRNIELAGTSNGDFQILSNIQTPFILDTLKPFPISVLFKPSKVGLITDTIKITTPGGVYSSTLTGIGIDRGLIAYSNVLDFGQVELGDSKDTVIQMLVVNKSQSDIQIQNISLQKPDTLHFSIISKPDQQILKPNETIGFILRYTPTALEMNDGTLVINNDGQLSPLKIALMGEGVLPRIDTLTIALGSISGSPGDIVELPIYIKNLSQFGLRPTIQGFSANIRFNGTLLKPLDFFPDWFDKQDRVMKVTIPSTFGSDSVLMKLKFKVALGNDSLSQIKIENVAPIGLAKMLINTEDGKFTLTGFCNQGSPRLFDENGRIYLNQTYPNPTNSIFTLDFSLIENGYTHLFIIDYMGQIVKTIIDQNMQKGKYQIKVNTADLASGQYQCILETLTRRYTTNLIIQR
jgi:WD40 repeat protein